MEKVLYVDDEAINVMLFKANFKKTFMVITGMSGFEGLELLAQHPDVRVVISDMKMPGMNGIEFIKKAKSKYPHLIFYILTGFDITPEIEDALASGLIAEYYSKPFNVRELEGAILGALD
jgi:CheY-like chemotaxis protein